MEHVSDLVSVQHFASTLARWSSLPPSVDEKTAFPLVVTVPSILRTQRSNSIVEVERSDPVTMPPHSRASPR